MEFAKSRECAKENREKSTSCARLPRERTGAIDLGAVTHSTSLTPLVISLDRVILPSLLTDRSPIGLSYPVFHGFGNYHELYYMLYELK